jgi:hypothetical protein
VKIEAKADVIGRLGVSPDRADALLLAFHEAGSEPLTTGAVDTFRESSLHVPTGSSPFGGSHARPMGAPLPPGAPVHASSSSSSLLR